MGWSCGHDGSPALLGQHDVGVAGSVVALPADKPALHHARDVV
jgi:hypothetical protein